MKEGRDSDFIKEFKAEVERDQGVRFPIQAFPEKIRAIISDLHKQDGMVVEYLGSAILSATATAIGNALWLRVRGSRKINPAFYMVFVSDPGTGKSQPIDAAYRAIYERDSQQSMKHMAELRAYNHNKKDDPSLEKPKVVQTIVADITPEALIRLHADTPRGVAIVMDELSDLFVIASRYNASTFVTHLLSAWSGTPLRYMRVSSDSQIVIERPCINIIGGVQTARFQSFVQSGNCLENGMLDRMTLVYPKNLKVQRWNEFEDDSVASECALADLAKVVKKLLSLKCNGDKGVVLQLTDEAKSCLFEWQNSIIDAINDSAGEEEAESRNNKLVIQVSRFALALQALFWATGEEGLEKVGIKAVETAIALNAYYQDCYHRLIEDIGLDSVPVCSARKIEFLGQLPVDFTTAQAIAAGNRMKINERTMKRWLSGFVRDRVIEKIEHGKYRKR